MVERWENRQPTESTTSAASSASCVARRLGRTPCQSGSVSAIAPRPMTDVMTGARSRRASAWSSPVASAAVTPPPATRRGRSARARYRAASSIRPTSHGGRRPAPAGVSRAATGALRTSVGIESATGPGRPVRKRWKAPWTAPGISAPLAQRIGPPADRPEALDLVRHLVERAHVLTDQGRGNVRHHEEHGLGARLRLDERRQRIGRARPGRDDDDARPARGPGIAVGHEAGTLLVPRQDVADPFLPEKGVVDGEVVDPRDAEDVSHALGLERGHHPLAPGPAGHVAHRTTVAWHAIARTAGVMTPRSVLGGQPERQDRETRPRRPPAGSRHRGAHGWSQTRRGGTTIARARVAAGLPRPGRPRRSLPT